MVLDARVRLDAAEVKAALERLLLALPLGGNMQRPFEAMGRGLKTGAQMRFRTMRGPDGNAWSKSRRAQEEGGQTLSLTRRLRNSITYRATPTSVEVGTNVVYAAIHQFGGVIRAKKGPFLAIPVTPQARAAGSPRNMTGLAVAQTLKGQFVMLDSQSGTVHYLLRKQVTMPERPFLGASSDDRAELLRVLQTHYEGVWRRR